MEKIESFVKHWPRAVLLMVIGALLGWVLWMFLPQSYTAVSRLSVIIDYNRTGKLDTIEQDRMLGITEDFLHSEEIMRPVFQQSSAPDYKAFFDRTRTTRTNETWSLTITGEDPEEIGKLALLWLDTAYEALSEGLEHAIRAEALENELEGLTRCVQESAGSSSACPADPEQIRQQIDVYTQQIREEQSASRGLPAAILLGGKDSENLEIRPASRSAAADTFIGACCGLLAAFAAVWFPESGKKA